MDSFSKKKIKNKKISSRRCLKNVMIMHELCRNCDVIFIFEKLSLSFGGLGNDLSCKIYVVMKRNDGCDLYWTSLALSEMFECLLNRVIRRFLNNKIVRIILFFNLKNLSNHLFAFSN